MIEISQGIFLKNNYLGSRKIKYVLKILRNVFLAFQGAKITNEHEKTNLCSFARSFMRPILAFLYVAVKALRAGLTLMPEESRLKECLIFWGEVVSKDENYV